MMERWRTAVAGRNFPGCNSSSLAWTDRQIDLQAAERERKREWPRIARSIETVEEDERWFATSFRENE